MSRAPAVLAFALAPVVAASCGRAAEEPDTRGLVLIVVDTLRADHGGALAGGVATPHLDRLAGDGVRFSEAFTHAPITLPAHVALFSSRPCHATGVLVNGQPVPPDLPLVAEHLRELGWRTRAVTSLGSMLIGEAPGGLSRGFETYVRAGTGFIDPGEAVATALEGVLDGLDAGAPFFVFAHFSDPHEPYNDHAGSETAEILVDGERVDTVGTSNMTTWSRQLALDPGRHRIELSGAADFRVRTLHVNRDGEPLDLELTEGRLKVPLRAVTAEFVVPGGTGRCGVRLWITDHPQRDEIPRRYGSEVAHADAQVGAFLDALRARDLYDTCLVILTSDHGESIGERRFIGHVRSLDDELLHVPLLVKPPAGSTRRRALEARSSDLVALTDVVPTALDLLGLPPLPGQRGFSLLGPERREFVVAQTVLPDSLKEARIEIDLLAIRGEREKLVYHVDEDRFEYFGPRAGASEPGGWRAKLRQLYEVSLSRDGSQVDDEALETLRALGYLDG